MDEHSGALAARVARAADAWLTDPLDVVAYQHLVQAVEAWRAHCKPMLEGTEKAGRRRATMDPQLPLDLPPTHTASAPAVSQASEPSQDPELGLDEFDIDAFTARAPATLGTALADVIAQMQSAIPSSPEERE